MTTESQKKVINVLVGLIILFLLFFLLKDWLRPRLINVLGGVDGIVKTDTITKVSIVRDTVWQEKRIVTTVKITEPTPTSSIKGKTDNDIISSIVYNNPINDSLIEGNISTTISTPSGKMLNQSIDYKPKFPIIVTEYKTITNTIEKKIEQKPKAYIGIGITGTTTNKVGGLLMYQTPKKWQIQAGYLKTLNTNLELSPSKGEATISITKLF